MIMSVNEASGVPLYVQVAAQVREAIQAGELSAGNRLPPAEELGRLYGVGRVTALKAIGELQAQGFVTTKRGQGTFIASTDNFRIRIGSDRYRRSSHGMSPNIADGRAAGWSPEVDGKADVTVATDALARRLGISTGDALSSIHYVFSDEGQPIQISTQWEPLALTAGTGIEVPPSSGQPDVITRFDAIGTHVDHVDEVTRTRMPTTVESAELLIGAGTPVLVIERTHWAGKVAVETADIVIRGDRMAIVTSHTVPMDKDGQR